MWLNLSEDECRGVGSYAADTSHTPIPDEPLIDVAPEVPQPPTAEIASNASPATTTPLPITGTDGSLFQSLASEDSDSSAESEDELNMNKVNETWAALMLELDDLKANAGITKGKGKKSRAVILETPDMVKLKNKIGRLEKEYMFSKKDAGACTLIYLSN